jgi:NitT/TauT family transport system substrate-binding protein
MNRKALVLVMAVIVIVIAVIGVSVLSLGPSPSATAADQLRLGAPPLEQNTLVYVAIDKGFFDKNGLNVTIDDTYPTGVGPVSDVSSGALDLSISSEYVIVNRVFSGGNISILATIDRYQNENLISRKDFGIRNISDLRGKRIGLPRGTILEFFLGRLLELNGLSFRDVTLVEVNTTHAPDAIANGEVDALMYFQPHITRILDRLGENAVIWPGQSNQSLYGVIAGRNDWIAAHPSQIRRFLVSLDEARQYSAAHPEETQEIVRRHLNVTDVYLGGVWQDHQFTLSLDQSLLLAMNDEGRWIISNNLTDKKTIPDFRAAVSPEGLAGVQPGSVNIR